MYSVRVLKFSVFANFIAIEILFVALLHSFMLSILAVASAVIITFTTSHRREVFDTKANLQVRVKMLHNTALDVKSRI